MTNNPLTIYKLMILYMLKKVSFMLSNSQLSQFFLEYEYTNYFTFQEAISDLVDTKLLEDFKTKTNIRYKLTDEGQETINTFIGDIDENAIKDMDNYISENKYKLREESILFADFNEIDKHNYKCTLSIKESDDYIFNMEIDAPDADTARLICERWHEKAKNIYAFTIKQLL